MARYLDMLAGALADRGYARDVFITTSNGGVATAARARQLPVGTVLSGPAGGVAASVHLGRLRGEANLITCDMGGTSTDVCLIENLRIPVTARAACRRLRQPHAADRDQCGRRRRWLDRLDR